MATQLLPVEASFSNWREKGTMHRMLKVRYVQELEGVIARNGDFEMDLREHFRRFGLEDGTVSIQCTPVLILAPTSSSINSVTFSDAMGLVLTNEAGVSAYLKHRHESVLNFQTNGNIKIRVDGVIAYNDTPFTYLEFSLFDHYRPERYTNRITLI